MRGIVPQNRLLQWFALVYLPFATLAVLIPSAAPVSVGLVLAMTVTAVADALLSRNRIDDVHISVPESLRMSVGRGETLRVRIAYDRLGAGQLRIGMSLPAEFDIRPVIHQIDLARHPGGVGLEWYLEAGRKGRYRIGPWHLEISSRLGLWAVRQQRHTPVGVRVYPNLMGEKNRLAALFMRQHLGLQVQRQVGKGREFDQLREYQPGDSYEDIHWKATAKRNLPITKVYQIERTQRIYTVLDASRLSGRMVMPGANLTGEPEVNGAPVTILDRYITAALIMALAAERQGDHFGLLTFSDQVRSFIPAKNGMAHYNACRDVLFTLEARRVSPDFTDLFAFIGTRLRHRSLLVFLTHMDDPVLAESFAKHIDLVARRHVVMVNILKPPAAAPLFSSESVSDVNDIYRHLGGHLLWRRLEETRKVLLRRGAGFAQLSSEGLCTDIVSQYLALKQRQAL